MNEDLVSKIAECAYWYHKIDLGNGIVTPGWAPIDHAAYRVPDRFDEETVVDVGAWDGYWTFHAAQRGAKSVIAVDDFSDSLGLGVSRQDLWKTFDICQHALKLKNVMRFSLDVQKPMMSTIFRADRVFFFGTLYHLKKPMQALENLFHALNDGGTIHVESAILDGIISPYTGKVHRFDGCHMEFYPKAEFGNNPTNWWVPTLRCIKAMMETVGFVDVETWRLTDEPENLAQCRGFAKGRKP